MKSSIRIRLLAAGCLAAIASLSLAQAQTAMVGSQQDFLNAIAAGDTTIDVTQNITLTTPIFIGTTSSPTITINGGGNTITSSSEIFFVQSGNITINNATLSGTAAGGNGGTGQSGGGGALGAGGAIFVGATASVTASKVQFLNNSATGGSSSNAPNGFGGGGGMNGGNGGNGVIGGTGGGGGNGGNGGQGYDDVGGGGGGLLSAGAASSTFDGGRGGGVNGGAGNNYPSAPGPTTSAGHPGGPNGGGGGGSFVSYGGTGGNGGTNGGGGGGGSDVGGAGGAYGGGGASTYSYSNHGGNGGFGGGGGASPNVGGTGGFGGGGGANGTGGVGGGNGIHNIQPGAGGAGLGGAVFVQQGGSFIVTGSGTFTGNTTVAGTGANNGASAGSDLFVMTGAGTTFAPGTGNTVTLNGTIADDSAASLPGGGYTPGTASGATIVIGASGSTGGTVVLNHDNTYSGGTDIGFGTTLAVGSAGALGSGPVTNVAGTLTVGNGNQFIVAATYSQGPGGTLALNVTGNGAGANADRLIITNGTASGAALDGALTINFGGFTIPMGSPHTFDLTVVQTDSGYTGTFTSLDAIGLHGAVASLDYSNADDVELQVNLEVAIATAGLTENEQAPLGAINTALAKGVANPALAGLSHALLQLSGPAAIGGAAAQLSPLKFNHFASVTAFNDESFEVQSEDTYLASQREGPGGTFTGGNGQLDTSGLTVNDPNVDPGLQMIHSRMLAWNAPSMSVTDVPGAMLGGVDMKACTSCNATCDDPWNVFVRGNVILAQGFSQTDQSHFDDNTESVVLGADYRITPHLLVGATAGYAHTDATLDAANSSATVDSYSPGLYASYADRGWYANLIGRYSHNSYTEDRVVSVIGQSATGATDGNEGMADLDGGYDFHAGPWTFGPLAGLQYTHLTVNSYREGGSDASLNVDEDQSDSLRSRLGGSVTYDFRSCGVTFSPHVTASWQHEFLDASRGITSEFADFSGGSFDVRTENSSADSALVDAGLNAKVGASVTVFGDYLVQAGQDNYFGQSVQAGVRVNF